MASLSSSLGPRLFLETKFQVVAAKRGRGRRRPTVPQVQISDTGTFGGALFLPSTQDMYRYQVSENVGYRARQAHDIKFGADYNAFNMRNNSFALALNGAYTFPTLEAFIAAAALALRAELRPQRLHRREAALLDSFWQHEVAAYVAGSVQAHVAPDDRAWPPLRPADQSAAAGGHRRRARCPSACRSSSGNEVQLTYAPVPQGIPARPQQLGAARRGRVPLAGDGSTIVKGSAGLYYGRTPMIYFPLRGAGVSNTTLFAPPSRFGVTFPEVLPSAIAPGSALATLVGPPAISYVDPELRESARASAHRLCDQARGRPCPSRPATCAANPGTFASADFARRRGTATSRRPREFDQFGRGIDILAAGRPDTTIAQANALASFGRGRYQALCVSLSKPMSEPLAVLRELHAREEHGQRLDRARHGSAASARRIPSILRRTTASTSSTSGTSSSRTSWSTLPHDVTLASTWSAGSGLAFPVYSSTDLNGDGVTNDGLHPDRPVVDGRLLPRFPYHQPAWFTWDLRAAKGVGLGRTGTRAADPRDLQSAERTTTRTPTRGRRRSWAARTSA